MNLFILAGIVGILVILIGVIIAVVFVLLSNMVTSNQVELEAKQSAINPAVTLGHKIPAKADIPEQLAAARKLAAKQAAALPRGANMRIGRLGASTLKTASQGVEDDPWTAVKIAAFHTWQGVKSGPPAPGAAQQTTVARRAAPAPTKKPEDLVPGKDYPFIEITDDMPPDEVRRARIANARARSAAVKALKQQGSAAAPAESAPAAAPAVAPAQTASPAAGAVAAANVPEPEYIEITDDMPPDEVRKARIANARARSAYMKALKAAGVDPSQLAEGGVSPAAAPAATEASAQAAQPAEPTPATDRQAVAVPADIPQPEYIEITDDMPPDEVRKARVHNARERSRYFKALKDRGIDPQALEEQQAAPAAPQPAAEAAAPAAQEAVPPPQTDGAGVVIPAHIAEPNYIEITDDMSPEEVRQARVHNSKERSQYFKALKAAGIDPKQVVES